MNIRSTRAALQCGLGLATLAVSSGAVVAAPVTTFQVTGAVAQPAAWSMTRLRQTFSASVKSAV